MNTAFLARLRCSYCQTGFTFKPAKPGFGILTCSCDHWPVVDGIPILQRTPLGVHKHTTGDAQTAQTDYKQLVGLIADGQETGPLVRCLTFPLKLARLARWGGWRVQQAPWFEKLRYALCAPQVRKMLARRESLTATDLFRFFCRPDSPLGEETCHYFTLRFTQPRQLAALALLENIPADDKPVLDIACGAGHFDHYLTERREANDVIGSDINFFQLWIAKHWIAPKGEFVCADLRDGLPFATDAFSAVVCSDAYHYVPNRGLLVGEMRRCAPGRLTILTRVGNVDIGPNEGRESTVDGYLQEIGVPAHVFDEHHLVRDYLARRNPFASASDQTAEARECKWLSFVWNTTAAFKTVSLDWPHAVGKLVLNPTYRAARTADGWRLRHAFPSVWFAFENGGMLEYQPLSASIKEEEMQEATRKFLAIGVPEKYC